MATEITPDEIEEQTQGEELQEDPASELETQPVIEPTLGPVTESTKRMYFFPEPKAGEAPRSVEASSMEEAQKLVENE